MSIISRLEMAAVSVCLILLSNPVASEPYEIALEHDLVSKHKEAPIAILENIYDSKKILFLGISNHGQSYPIDYLIELLKSVGEDPNLKIIALEWMNDNSEIFNRLSTESLNSILDDYSFDSLHEEQHFLCTSSEKAYTVARLMPILRKINTKRPDNPVIAHSIDSFDADKPINWPSGKYGVFSDKSPEINYGDCKLNNEGYFTRYTSSDNREIRTANLFKSIVWDKIGSEDKAIVVYHQNHLYTNFKSCNAYINDTNSITTNITQTSWLGYFLEEHPNAKENMGIVFFDSIDKWHNPYGAFRMTYRNRSTNESEPWGISLNRLFGLDLERGGNMFQPNSILPVQKEGIIYSDKTLHEIADAIIHIPNASELYTYPRDIHTRYLGKVCKDGKYNGRSLYEYSEK